MVVYCETYKELPLSCTRYHSWSNRTLTQDGRCSDRFEASTTQMKIQALPLRLPAHYEEM